MAPLSYYWIISFIYLVIEKKAKEGKYLYSGNRGSSPDINPFERFSSFYEIFFNSVSNSLILFFPLPHISSQKEIRIYVLIRYYELQRVVQQVPDYVKRENLYIY
jgi:hypothetical protein